MLIQNLISKFSTYIFGYEYIKNPSFFSSLLNGKELVPIFSDKSGSVVCIWEKDNKKNIVWIDSEGTPCNVFGESINDFLEIMPYGPEFIYDYLSAIENHKLSPNLIPHPSQTFTTNYINKTYIKNKADKKIINDYSDWLKKKQFKFKRKSNFRDREIS